MKIVNVAVGVILRADRVFLAKRAATVHQGGKWEFPGGKIEIGESPVEALKRELLEEVGISFGQPIPMCTINHNYGDKCVCLHVMKVENFDGEPFGKENQQTEWRAIVDLKPAEFPAANVEIIQELLALKSQSLKKS